MLAPAERAWPDALRIALIELLIALRIVDVAPFIEDVVIDVNDIIPLVHVDWIELVALETWLVIVLIDCVTFDWIALNDDWAVDFTLFVTLFVVLLILSKLLLTVFIMDVAPDETDELTVDIVVPSDDNPVPADVAIAPNPFNAVLSAVKSVANADTL